MKSLTKMALTSIVLFSVPSVQADDEKYFFMQYISIERSTAAITDVCYGDRRMIKEIKNSFREESKDLMVPKFYYKYDNNNEERVLKNRRFSIEDFKRDGLEIHYFDYCQ
ncbi:hypothetical protein [Vibrio parahaemolyticus]|uniref:hypothetical protein n=1 Tax=Vibrio parahaemolyticus TaxID=670 RepID=UPI00387B42D7